MRVFLIILVISLLSLDCFTGCRQPETPNGITVNADTLKESLLNANKQAVKTEDEQIRELLDRYGWQMSVTGTGLRYHIYRKGNGPRAFQGMTATINYTIKSVTGTLIYSSSQSGPKRFMIGRGEVESGLEQGILMMQVGDKAKLILPSHLAWGLTGDQDRIPPKTTLVYDVELINLEQ